MADGALAADVPAMNGRGRKIADAVSSFLEPGEEVRYAFTTQTASPAWALISSLIVLFSGYRTVVVTDRNLYILRNKWARSYKFQDEPDLKVALADADLSTGKTWVCADGRQKLYVGLAVGKHIRAVEQLTSGPAEAAGLAAGTA